MRTPVLSRFGALLFSLVFPLAAQAQAQLQPVPAQPVKPAAGAKALGSKSDGKIASTLRAAAQAVSAGPTSNGIAALPDYVQQFIAREVAADNTIFVVIRAVVTDDLIAAIKATGAYNVKDFRAFGQVTAQVPAGSLSALAQRSDVAFIGPREKFTLNRWVPPPGHPALRARAKFGTTLWEGVSAHQADFVQGLGVRGTGVKVCVMSDGVDSLASRQVAGELPAVSVIPGQAGSGDEGTAMLEIVADMAPGATLGFATALDSPGQFASNIVALQASGCNIIVDDVSYFSEAAFQDDVVSQAVNQVTGAGVMYFSSAANSGNLANVTADPSGGSGTYEGDFVAFPTVPAIISSLYGPVPGLQVQSFNGQPFIKLTEPTSVISLKWSDPTPTPLGTAGAPNDYDIWVIDAAETGFFCSPGTDVQSGTQPPVEITGCNSGVFPQNSHVYVVKFSGVSRAIRIDTHRGRLEQARATTGSTFGHNAAASAMSVAAIPVHLTPTPFTSADSVEFYSSDGPRKMFYNPNGTAITPGNVLFGTGGGTTLQKVDIAGADCGSTTTAGFLPFCGTSAAAPTVAGIAALAKSARLGATAAQVLNALNNTAIDIEAPGFDVDSGHGIALAPAAVRAVMSAPTLTRSFTPASGPAGATLTLATQIINANSVALTGGAVSVTVTPGATGANGALTTTGAGCLGTKTNTAGGFSLSAMTIPPNTTCTFSVPVALGFTAGAFSTSSNTLTTAIGLSGTAPAAAFTVTQQAALAMTVTATPSPAALGASVTLSVRAVASAGRPTGNISLTANATPIAGCSGLFGPVAVDGSSTFSCSTSTLGVGPEHIVANFAGDTAYASSTASTDLVVLAPTTTVLSATPALPALHQAVVFTATVSGSGVPTGTVQFLADASVINGCGASALVAGVAKCSTNVLTAGTHAIVAHYLGDTHFNVSTGNLSETIGSIPLPPPAGGAKALDFNGDGHADLGWVKPDGTLSLWMMDGVNPIQRGVVLTAAPGSVTRSGDLDGDGNVDLIRQFADGSVTAFFMSGIDVRSTALLRPAGTGWHLVNIGDFNGDHKTDLVWRHDNGAVEIWVMNGAAATGVSTVMPAGTAWTLSKVADFNGDGMSDLLWRNTNGSTAMWLMHGTTIAVTKLAGSVIMPAGSGWTATHVGDFNGDGMSDILWRHDADGAVSMWLMNGLATMTHGSIMPGNTGWNVMLAARLDNDNKSDILWHNNNGTSSAWIMDGLTAVRKGQLFAAGSPWTAAQAVDTSGNNNATLVWRHPAGNMGIWTVNWSTTTNGAFTAIVKNPAFPAGSVFVPATSLEQNR